MVFELTREDFVAKFKPQKTQKGKLVASDLHNTLLRDVVVYIKTVEGLPVVYHPFLPQPSRNCGGRTATQLYPDKPQTHTICGTLFRLCRQHHYKLCLLRGLLKELLPDSSILGTTLYPIVRVSLVLCFAHCLLVVLFSVQEGLANRVIRSLEKPSCTSYDDTDDTDEVSSTNL